jgi:hypothetical protein
MWPRGIFLINAANILSVTYVTTDCFSFVMWPRTIFVEECGNGLFFFH